MRHILAAAMIAVMLNPTSRAQEATEDRLGRMQLDLSRLSERLEAKERREAELESRIMTLETTIEHQRVTHASQLRELEDKLEGANPAPTELEEAVLRLQDDIAAVATSNGANSALSLGGYFDFEFRDDDAARGSTFDQHRLILQVTSQILPKAIAFRAEIEIEGGGADVSFLSDNEILVEFAELHFFFDRSINLKAGALLVPFNQFNALHDSPLQDLTDRPLVARRIVPTTWTEAGIGLYGAFDVPGVTFDYDVILSNGLDDDFSTTRGGGFRGNRSSFRADNNVNKMVAGRLGVRPDLPWFDSVYVGGSFAFGEYDDSGHQSYRMWGVDWKIRKGPFEILGEYAEYDLDRSASEVAAGAPGGASGYYAQINFHFFPEAWRGMNRFFTSESTFTLVFRYGTIDTDHGVAGIDRETRGDGLRDDITRYTVGLNFRPIEQTVFKIEYQFITEDGVRDAGNDRLVLSFATYF